MDVGVIGTGIMGKNHARIYSELKAVGDLFVFDINQNAAMEVAKTYNGEAVNSMAELLRRSEAVSLCVPTPFHFKTATDVIEKGVNTLIEKPICHTRLEGEALVKVIPEDLTVGVGHIERFNPIIPEISRMISDPYYVELHRHNPSSSRIIGSSVLEDLMIHDIDVINHCLFSELPDFVARGNDDVVSVIGTSGDCTIQLSASRRASKKIRLIRIEQEDMTIEGDYMTQEIHIYRKPDQYFMKNHRYVQENIVEKVMVPKNESLRVELQTFLTCARNNKEFPVTPVQALQNLCTCNKIQMAMAS